MPTLPQRWDYNICHSYCWTRGTCLSPNLRQPNCLYPPQPFVMPEVVTIEQLRPARTFGEMWRVNLRWIVFFGLLSGIWGYFVGKTFSELPSVPWPILFLLGSAPTIYAGWRIANILKA